jgi:large subunit ribosomal protein L18e
LQSNETLKEWVEERSDKNPYGLARVIPLRGNPVLRITFTKTNKINTMAKRTGPSNANLQALIKSLKKQASEEKRPLWKRIALDLELPTRKKRIVNLNRLNHCTKENEHVIIPGKVLGTGELNHKLTIAAFTFSESAREKISKANGNCITIPELVEKNPSGKDIRIIG